MYIISFTVYFIRQKIILPVDFLVNFNHAVILFYRWAVANCHSLYCCRSPPRPCTANRRHHYRLRITQKQQEETAVKGSVELHPDQSITHHRWLLNTSRATKDTCEFRHASSALHRTTSDDSATPTHASSQSFHAFWSTAQSVDAFRYTSYVTYTEYSTNQSEGQLANILFLLTFLLVRVIVKPWLPSAVELSYIKTYWLFSLTYCFIPYCLIEHSSYVYG